MAAAVVGFEPAHDYLTLSFQGRSLNRLRTLQYLVTPVRFELTSPA